MPEFDPNQPFETVVPKFDPNKPFEEVKPERGVLQRAGEAVAETAKAGVRHAKELVTEPPETPDITTDPVGALVTAPLKNIGTTAKGLLSPVTTTLGALGSGAASLISSGMAAVAPTGKKMYERQPLWDVLRGGETYKEVTPPQTSEEKYEYFRPQVETALAAARPAAPGSAGLLTGKGLAYPKPSEYVAPTKEAAGAEAEAGRIIRKSATDPGAVERTLANPPPDIVPGSKPTTFQLTADPGLGQLERVSANARNVAEFRQRAAEQNTARLRELERVGGTGSPQEVADHLSAAMRSEQMVADANYAAAQQLARDAATQLGGAYDATNLRREIMQAEAAARANERALWRAVNPDGTLRANPQPLQELERGIYGNLTEAATASLTPAERQISGLIQGYRPVIPFQELTDLRSLTSTAMRQERLANGESPALGRLIRLRQGIEDTVTRSVFDENAQRQAAAAQRLQEASAATRERAQTFNIRPIRDITRREGAAGPYRMGEASVPRAIVKPGPGGYDTASAYFRAVGNERGLPDVTGAVAADLRQAGVIDANTGMANPAKLQTWMRQREGVLRAISERDNGAFAQRLANAGDAANAVQEAEAAQEAARAAYASADIRKVTGAVSDEQVSDIIGNIFSKPDSILRARDLAGRLTTPEALEGAQRAIVDYILKRYISNAPGIGQDNLIRAEQFQNFVRHNKGALRQFLSPEQVTSLEAIATDIRRMNLSMQTKAKGGSDTAQLLYNMEQQRQSILSRLGSMLTEHAVGRIPVVGKPAKMALKLLPHMVEGVRAKEVARIQGLVDQGMLDPARAAELLRAAQPVAKVPKGAGIVYGTTQTQQLGEQQAPRATGGDVSPRSSAGVRSPGKTTPAGDRQTRQGTGEALSNGGATGDGEANKTVGGPRFVAGREGSPAAGTWSSQLAGRRGGIGKPTSPLKTMSHEDIVDVLRARNIRDAGGFSRKYWEVPAAQEYADGGAVSDGRDPDVDSRDNVNDIPPLPLPPYEAAAARIRRRYPVREPDPRALAASQGKAATWGQVGQGMLDVIKTPQRAYEHGLTPEEEAGWAAPMAVGMIGAGTPFARPGTLGAAGGKASVKGLAPELKPEGGLGRHPTTMPEEILRATGEEGGYSVRLPTGERPTEGLMMGMYRNADPRNLVVEKRLPTPGELEGMVGRNIKALEQNERYLGTWRDPETGNVYLDVSERFKPGQIRKATKFGERTGQLAGFNVGARESFPVGNWREFIGSPEFHQRMREMEGVGRDYLSKFPAQEWWDMPGSSFERVYGSERLPQVAGFTASTAPNTAPRPNLQQMSEYMRRSIQGEPTVQPAWRTPETVMTGQPGKQLPLEQSRIANLLKSQRAELDLLQRNKVREEAAAMMGDPGAVVLDRHWARIAEDPARGIFTNVQEGVVGSSPRKGGSDYDLLKREVVGEATNRGRDPRDFSADVWTGIRHTIQSTNELYGTKFRRGSIPGESKSYADHFNDLVDEKAAHLGITRGKMEELLRSGRGDLLLYLMSTIPAAREAYRVWLGQSPETARPSSGRSQQPAAVL